MIAVSVRLLRIADNFISIAVAPAISRLFIIWLTDGPTNHG
jgi:hypothetical protein